MASRPGQPSLTAKPRSTQVALVPARLPYPEPGASEESAPTDVMDRTVRPRVAALDDDPAAVASIMAILNQSGFEVYAFTDPGQLEDASGAAPFAAFVLDWYLGNTTAAALIAGLRERPVSAHVPIFVLSGNLAIGGVPTDETLARTIVRHRVHYRAKPYSGVKLAADLRLALSDQKG